MKMKRNTILAAIAIEIAEQINAHITEKSY